MVAVRPCRLVPCVALLLACASCLPDRYNDAELSAKIAAATDGGADATPVTGCGNGTTEEPEQCDELSPSICGGCVSCERRRVLQVADDNALALLDNTDNILLAAKDGLSLELWAKPTVLPQDGKFTALATLAQIPAGVATPSLVMGYVHDTNKNAAYPSCFYLIGSDGLSAIRAVVQASEPGKVGEWQHMRCAYSATDKKLHLAANGGAPSTSTQSITKLGKLLEEKTKLVFGAFAAGSDGPAFRGQLDELRIVTGANADDFPPVPLRYTGSEPGTQLLYHMDEKDTSRTLADSSGNQLNAVQLQLSPTYGVQTADFVFAAESCYGHSEPQAKCEGSAGLPPWCAAK